MSQSQQIPKSESVQNHIRVNDTVVTRLEKKALHWLAARMPAWVVPDTLTLIGLIASILIFTSYGLTYFNKNFLWLASFGFILNWFGDSLDGTLARYRKIERPRYGFFVDHIIDAVSEVLVFIGLGLSPYLRFDLALIALVSYLLASIYVYLTTYVNGVFRISYSGLSPTEIRLIAIGANTLVFFTGNYNVVLPFITLSIFDLIVMVLTVIIFVLFITNSISTAMTLSLEDRVVRREKRQKERIARRQALQDQRAARKAAARAARQPHIRVTIE